jgi:hypothetical protein
VGFTSQADSVDPEDVEALLRPYHQRVRSELERHGGTVEKFIGDAVMALFGAPTAHEDDPERAVRAALAIRDFAAEEGLELRVGVTTGEALISLDARPDAGEGMASGDVVNTAARLQSAAPVNGVITDKTTYRATRHAIDYRDADGVEAKGKAEPIPVWEAVAAHSRFGVDVAHEARSELIGRERELGVCLAHNLARWIARLGLGVGPIVAQTIRRRYLTLPGRITRSARRATLHLPARWPWRDSFGQALARLRAIPLLI